MESVDLQMEDIFGDGDDDPFSTHTDIPDLPPDLGATDQPTDGQNIENDAVLARLRDLSRGAAARTVKRVQPKLDPARLTGDRGIGILPQIFKDVRFKGKGHEAEDLKKVMRYLEHWTHRLFPKMPFDEVLQRIEKLGTKKEVQTYIKRMRMDVPMDNEDNATNEDADEVLDDSTDRTGEASSQRGGQHTSFGADEEEVLDEMLREEEEQRTSQSQRVDQSESSSSVSANQSTFKLTNESQTPSKTSSAPATPGGLTAEQLERMEANKRRAQERRMARLGHKTPVAGTPSGGQCAQADTPLAYPASPSTSTGQSVASLQQVPSASPVMSETRGGHSPSKVPKLDLQTESDQVTEDQLLADLEDEQTPEATKSQIQDESLSPLHLDLTESLSQNAVPTSEVSGGMVDQDNSHITNTDVT